VIAVLLAENAALPRDCRAIAGRLPVSSLRLAGHDAPPHSMSGVFAGQQP
jgi:hypothetical protein